ncbi:transcription initiation factor IIA large subunit-like [Rhododendron vialii]|uniref:transcription initiation factor IIA large subunit-like n=1 Tax=Rhododendron vialii TaxID=182163 RepID=UPI00265E32BE|nr:transcription initiation factor IIA large subunit-like [Rhododendron vialii]
MATSSTSGVYVHVIEDVINKVREEFLNNGGPGESVLNELQGIWELKMMQAGAILGPIERSLQRPTPGGPITPVHDLNVPYEGTEEYETPTAEILFPPTPLETPMRTPLPGTAQTPLPGTAQTPLPGTADSSMYNMSTAGTPISPGDYPSLIDSGVPEMKPGRPSPYMQPPSAWMNQRPPLDVNVAYVEGREELDRGTPHQPTMQDFFMMSSGKRKRDELASQYRGGSGYIPQQDGAGDAMSDDFQGSQGGSTGHDIVAAGNQWVWSSSRISQLDGPIPDPYDDVLSTPNIYNYQGVVNEDYNIVNTPAPYDQVATPAVISQNDIGDDDDDDEPLNENDDDDYDDVDQGEELNTQHLVLAQFDKVTRTKSRWKCTLKDGIMHINNKDILFNKATGEFDF